MSLGTQIFASSSLRYRSRGEGQGGWWPPTSSGSGDPMGLAAVACAIRLISESLGSFVMRAYEGDASKRQVLLDAPQAPLLQDGAEGYCTSIDLWSSVAASVEVTGNGFIAKTRNRAGAVIELWPWPAELTAVYVNSAGAKVVEALVNGERFDITADVIHVKGWSPIVDVSGQSALRRHRRMLNGSLGLQEFRGRYFDADMTPNLLIVHPGSPAKEQRDEFRESWQARHRGPSGEKTAFLWGNVTAQQLSGTLEESQVEQLMNLDIADVARMFMVYPRELLTSAPTALLPAAENVSDLFQRITLLSRERRIERAISADREIFPDRAVYCRFDTSEFVRGSIATTVEKAHKLKQVGAVTANEVRAELGYPPSDDPNADKLLETPVGAGPNTGGHT